MRNIVADLDCLFLFGGHDLHLVEEGLVQGHLGVRAGRLEQPHSEISFASRRCERWPLCTYPLTLRSG
jgi:hypothetical protein